MGVVSPKKLFERAMAGRYAIGAFNIYNMESIQAVIEAAQTAKAPLILQVSQSSLKYIGGIYLRNLIRAVEESTKMDFVLHLDHGEDYATCKQAVDLGFSSVMIDGSKLPLKENIKLTKKVVKYAHARRVWVEAELGRISGVEDSVSVSKKEAMFTDPQEAKEFVKETGCDSLAVAVGTSHGAYKFSVGSRPRVYFKRLIEIQKQIPEIPIVLHGSSNVPATLINSCNKYGGRIEKAIGMPDRVITKATKTHVCKINIDTDLRLATTSAIRRELATNRGNIDPRKYLIPAKEAVIKIVQKKCKTLGCWGKA